MKVCLKMRIFRKITVTIISASGISPPNPRLPLTTPPLNPHFVTYAYYYNFVEFVSGAKCVLLPLKRNKITTINVLLLYFSRNFAPIFQFKYCRFYCRGLNLYPLCPGLFFNLSYIIPFMMSSSIIIVRNQPAWLVKNRKKLSFCGQNFTLCYIFCLANVYSPNR